jgi:hypothetical protein
MLAAPVPADRLHTLIGDEMYTFPQPRYMPCAECGASVARAEAELHVCDPERRADFAFLQLREERERFDEQLTTYLESPRGRFEAWYASRRR